MKLFEGKVAIVAGGARDIGRAVSEKLAAEGAKVVVNYFNNKEEGEATLAAIKDAGGDATAAETWSPDAEYRQLLDCIGYDSTSIDSLVSLSGLTPAEVSSMLLQLELGGYVASSPGGLYNRLK